MDLGRQVAAERDRGEEGIRAGEREGECEMFKRLVVSGGAVAAASVALSEAQSMGAENGLSSTVLERAFVNSYGRQSCIQNSVSPDFSLRTRSCGFALLVRSLEVNTSRAGVAVAALLCRPGLLRLRPPGPVWQLRLCSGGAVL